jgi:hypothetical protein
MKSAPGGARAVYPNLWRYKGALEPFSTFGFYRITGIFSGTS